MNATLCSLALLLAAAGCGGVVPEESGEPDAAAATDADAGTAPEADADPGAPDAEACAAERCNGTDDDCDDGVDEGCPVEGAVAFGNRTATGLFGASTTASTVNTEAVLACPTGSVVTGLHGRFYEAIDQLGVHCGAPSIAHVTADDPWLYQVSVAAGETLAAQGGGGGVDFDAPCPAGKVAVGLKLWTADLAAGRSIYGIALLCAQPQLAGSIGQYVITGAALEETARTGYGHAGLTETTEVMACGGGALDGLTVYHGPWPVYADYRTVNGVKGSCVAPQLSLIEP